MQREGKSKRERERERERAKGGWAEQEGEKRRVNEKKLIIKRKDKTLRNISKSWSKVKKKISNLITKDAFSFIF